MSELRIGPASAELRATLRPIEWMVLEEVALAAGADETGVLVAPTNARQVGERLGLTAGTASRALARLRALGLVSHVRCCGPSGRFGPSSYVLGSIPGLEVVDPGPAPCCDPPCSGAPCVESPHMAAPSMGDHRPADTAGVAGRGARPDTSPVVEPGPTMASEPEAAAQERPAANQRRRLGKARPPRLDGGLQLELLAAPPSGSATKRAREHGH
ncbi:MAG TPA: helix-turn-helix domain-containing protein [Acidimicrobiales bacterium]|nr:helix-turn-helix domain-containing protein [Acidimicrobiales bacterium]